MSHVLFESDKETRIAGLTHRVDVLKLERMLVDRDLDAVSKVDLSDDEAMLHDVLCKRLDTLDDEIRDLELSIEYVAHLDYGDWLDNITAAREDARREAERDRHD